MASIQGIYLALFGRPVDPGGLAYWNEVTNGGQDLSKLIGGLTSSAEYLDRFEGQTSEQIVTSIYVSLFGRQPDAGGLAFFVEALESGSVERIAIQILDGAQGEDLTVVQNKEEAADIFTASLDTPEEIAAYVGEAAAAQARDLIDDVTADPASIPTEEQIAQAIEDIQDGETETPPPPPAGGGTPTNTAPGAPVLGSRSVDEETPGAVVGTVTASDAEGNALSFSVDDARFEVVGGVLKLKAGQVLDFEPLDEKSVELTITASDGALSTSAAFVVAVNDKADPARLSGTAVDGYISGATVFADANRNGVRDSGEVSTETDALGNFTLVGGSGPLVMTGGIDISTNTAFIGTMTAPAGSTVVTPLTTLVQALVADVPSTATPQQLSDAITAAQTKVLTGLGLSPTLNLATFDPIAATLSSDGPTKAAGAAAITAAIQIQNTIVQASAVVDTAGGSVTAAVAEAAVTKALAQAIATAASAPTPTTLDIGSGAALASILASASTETGAGLTNTVAAAVANAIAATNDAAADAAAAATNGGAQAILTALAQVSVVAQSSTVGTLVTAVQTNDTTNTNAITSTSIASAAATTTVGNVVGDNLNETKDGTAGADLLEGNGGEDTLNGFGGRDILDGGTGNDTLNGGQGYDRLIGGAGNDRIDGGTGYDFVWYYDDAAAGGTRGVMINLHNEVRTFNGVTIQPGTAFDGFGNLDTLINIEDAAGTNQADFFRGNDTDNYFTAFAGDDVMSGGRGFDGFQPGPGNDTVFGGGDGDEISYSNWTGPGGISIDLSNSTPTQEDGPKIIFTDPWGGTDTLYSIERVRGTNNDDRLIGDGANNRFRGLGGDDYMDGGAGTNDFVDYLRDAAAGGGAGVIVNLSANAVTIDGVTVAAERAKDGFGKTDTVLNFERVRGTDQNDVIFGNAADNRIDAAGGNDQIDGGAGTDTLLIDLTEFDLAGPLTSVTSDGVTIIRANGVDVVRVEVAGAVVTTTGLGPAAAYGVDTARTVEIVEVQNGNDPLLQVDVRTQPSAGIDPNGNGFINGTTGADTLDVATLLPGFGGQLTFVNGLGGDDTVAGTDRREHIRASAGNDVIDGRGGEDLLVVNLQGLGLGGPLIVDAVSPGGPFVLANGVRILQLAQSGGAVTVSGLNAAAGFGTETLTNVEFLYVQLDNANTVTVNVPLLVTTGLNNGTLFIRGTVFGDTIDVAAAVGAVNPPAGTFINVNGEFGHDTLIGTGSGEYLNGGRGNDTINAGGGDDSIEGSQGADTLDGGPGTGDFINYSNDTLGGGNAGVLVNLSASAVQAGPSPGVTVAAGTARDGYGDTDTLSNIERVMATNQSDGLFGDDGDNSFFGLDGGDQIVAGGGNDFINAGKGSDFVDGGAGTDTLQIDLSENNVAGPLTSETVGNDIIVKAAGAEVFRITSAGGGVTVTGVGAASDFGTDTVVGVETIQIRTNGAVPVNVGLQSRSGLDQNGGGFVEGTAFNDDLNVNVLDTTNLAYVVMRGYGGDDKLRGSDSREDMEGGDGNDTLIAGGGPDVLVGGRGADTLDGGNGPSDPLNFLYDQVDYSRDAQNGGFGGIVVNMSTVAVQIGGADGPFIQPGTAIDGYGQIDTLIEIEQVRGTGNNDSFYGDGDDNFFDGLGGDDFFSAGAGRNGMLASAGDDVYFGGADNDGITFDFAALGLTGAVTIDAISNPYPVARVGNTEVLKFEKVGGQIVITGRGPAAGFGTETVSGVEFLNIRLTQFGPTELTQRLEPFVFSHGSGGFIEGTFFGDAIDVVTALPGLQAGASVTVNGLLGADTINGWDTNDAINGGRANDILNGGGGNDYLVGGHGNDTLSGGESDNDDDIAAWLFDAGTQGTLALIDGEAGTKLVTLTNGTNSVNVFSITRSGNQATVVDLRQDSPFGTDTVSSDVERLHFFVQAPPNEPIAQGQFVEFTWIM